jgi:hypothetical protein
MAALLFALMLLGLVQGGPAAAQDAPTWAYVFGHDFSTDVADYTPAETYQYNSTGELNTIKRNDVGNYAVSMPGMSMQEGTVQITAITEDGRKCGLGAIKGKEAPVLCYDATGAPVDTNFFLLYFVGTIPVASGETSGAWVWGNDPVADSYTPDERYQYNSTGATNTITREGAGRYWVDLPGLGAESGNIQVTAGNSGPGVTCSVLKWELAADNLKRILVGCYDAAGQSVDSGYTLLYVDGKTPSTFYNGAFSEGAYVLVNHPDSIVGESYVPGKVWQYNTSGADNTVTRTDDGTYTVVIPGVASEEGTVQVTAGDNADVSCTVPRWTLEGSDTFLVDVICFDTAGNPVNSAFTLMYVVAWFDV